jgi:HEAT repeat protein
VYGSAAYALGEIGPAARAAIRALAQAFKENDPDLRRAVALALGKIQEENRRE